MSRLLFSQLPIPPGHARMKFFLMTRSAPDILSRIVDHKRAEIPILAGRRREWEREAEQATRSRRDFRAALTAKPPAIIAEIKKASPSKGVLTADFQPMFTARSYEQGGAAALSVLTDQQFFQGSLIDLISARAVVRLPVLRKDFTLDECQVVEAAAHGADAVLLIAAILTREEMTGLRELAASYRMAALVEVHNEAELDSAVDSGADIIGVNNRNLETFEVTLETSLRLSERIPEGAVRVSESGIHTPEDIRRLRAAGFDAFLVGEHLMTAPDPAAALRALAA
jgi:indole-3-glycerol phosphate synthase